jgi:hypothetical protein
LHEDVCAFVAISGWIRLRMRNISYKICRDNQNTHFVLNKIVSQNRTVYDIMWRNVVQPEESQMTEARTQTHTQNMQYLLFCHCNNSYANAPHWCPILPAHTHPMCTVCSDVRFIEADTALLIICASGRNSTFVQSINYQLSNLLLSLVTDV